MKILFVNKLYKPDQAGGTEVTIADVAAGLLKRGHEVMIATTTSEDRVVRDSVDGVPITRLPLRNVYWHNNADRASTFNRARWHLRDIDNAAMGEALADVIRDFDPDVIEFHNISGFSSSVWEVAHDAGKPTVQVLHDYYNLCPRSQLFRRGENCGRPCVDCKVFRLGRAKASGRLSAVVGVSRAVLGAHLENGLFADVKIQRVINNARPLKADASRVLPERAKTFGFIGVLAQWKGVELLFDAFSRLGGDPELKDLRLLVAGVGEAGYDAELRSRFAGSNIEFLGRVKPESFYPRIDVSIVPSIWQDPLPTVVIESLLFNVPVIGSRRGGIPEMVEDGVNGLLFDPDIPGELEAAIKQFALTPGLVRKLGATARSGAAHFADMERVIEEHVDVCRAAMQL